jgi:hypothetical protein
MTRRDVFRKLDEILADDRRDFLCGGGVPHNTSFSQSPSDLNPWTPIVSEVRRDVAQ